MLFFPCASTSILRVLANVEYFYVANEAGHVALDRLEPDKRPKATELLEGKVPEVHVG